MVLCRPDTFSLGVCNGCQLMALLGWVPGGDLPDTQQPRFVHNASGRFECRWATVEIRPSPSILLKAGAPAAHVTDVQETTLPVPCPWHQRDSRPQGALAVAEPCWALASRLASCSGRSRHERLSGFRAAEPASTHQQMQALLP